MRYALWLGVHCLSCGLDNVNTARLLRVNEFLGFPLGNGINLQSSRGWQRLVVGAMGRDSLFWWVMGLPKPEILSTERIFHLWLFGGIDQRTYGVFGQIYESREVVGNSYLMWVQAFQNMTNI